MLWLSPVILETIHCSILDVPGLQCQDQEVYLCWDSTVEEEEEDLTVTQFWKAVDDDRDLHETKKSNKQKSGRHKRKSKKHSKKKKGKKNKKKHSSSSSTSSESSTSSSSSKSSSSKSSTDDSEVQ